MHRALVLLGLAVITLSTVKLPAYQLGDQLAELGASTAYCECDDECATDRGSPEDDAGSDSPDDCPDSCPCRIIRTIALTASPPVFALLTSCPRAFDRPAQSHGRTPANSIDHPPRAL